MYDDDDDILPLVDVTDLKPKPKRKERINQLNVEAKSTSIPRNSPSKRTSFLEALDRLSRSPTPTLEDSILTESYVENHHATQVRKSRKRKSAENGDEEITSIGEKNREKGKGKAKMKAGDDDDNEYEDVREESRRLSKVDKERMKDEEKRLKQLARDTAKVCLALSLEVFKLRNIGMLIFHLGR